MVSDKNLIKIRFEDVTSGEASIKASNFRQYILDNHSDVQVDIEKEDPTTQDFGATLVLILGTPAILALSKVLRII